MVVWAKTKPRYPSDFSWDNTVWALRYIVSLITDPINADIQKRKNGIEYKLKIKIPRIKSNFFITDRVYIKFNGLDRIWTCAKKKPVFIRVSEPLFIPTQ